MYQLKKFIHSLSTLAEMHYYTQSVDKESLINSLNCPLDKEHWYNYLIPVTTCPLPANYKNQYERDLDIVIYLYRTLLG